LSYCFSPRQRKERKKKNTVTFYLFPADVQHQPLLEALLQAIASWVLEAKAKTVAV
jgi:hypothetical protein